MKMTAPPTVDPKTYTGQHFYLTKWREMKMGTIYISEDGKHIAFNIDGGLVVVGKLLPDGELDRSTGMPDPVDPASVEMKFRLATQGEIMRIMG